MEVAKRRKTGAAVGARPDGAGGASPPAPAVTVAGVREALWAATVGAANAATAAAAANAAATSQAAAGGSVGAATRPAAVSSPTSDHARLNGGDSLSCPVAVPRHIAEHLMSPGNHRLLTESTGVSADWNPGDKEVVLSGSAEQVNAGKRALQRIVTHCFCGVHEEKVRRLLSPRTTDIMYARLSPIGVGLKPVEKVLCSRSPTLSMGKDKGNDAMIADELISRQHCVLELDMAKGLIYVLDLSTNGTFLNGKRLPQKKQGKIIVSHGDELMLKDPNQDGNDLGYLVNLVDPSRSTASTDEAEGENELNGTGRECADHLRESLRSGK